LLRSDGLSPAKVLSVSEFVASPSSLSRNEEPNRSVGRWWRRWLLDRSWDAMLSIGSDGIARCHRPQSGGRRRAPSAERSVPVRDRPRPAWSCLALPCRPGRFCRPGFCLLVRWSLSFDRAGDGRETDKASVSCHASCMLLLHWVPLAGPLALFFVVCSG
jgi:hypothetical protein